MKNVEIPLSGPEKAAKENQNQKWTPIQFIQKEYDSGKSLSRIGRENQLNYRTVRKYVDMKHPPADKRP